MDLWRQVLIIIIGELSSINGVLNKGPVFVIICMNKESSLGQQKQLVRMGN